MSVMQFELEIGGQTCQLHMNPDNESALAGLVVRVSEK